MKSKTNDMNKELQRDRFTRAIQDLCRATDLLKKIRKPVTVLKIVNLKDEVSKAG